MSHKDTFEHFDGIFSALEGLKKAAGSSHGWHWEKMRYYAEALFERGPFKPGDRVRLLVTPEINEKTSWGWLGAKHFLVKGALGTVKHVDYSKGHFRADVIMDDESHLDRDGVKHMIPLEKRGLFCFWDTDIEKVEGTEK